MAAPQLTFGIELEFIAISAQDPAITIGERIFYRLKQAGLQITGFVDHDEEVENGRQPYRSWRLEEEYLGLSQEEERHLPPGYVIEGCELVSPVFDYNNEQGWLTEIQHALKALRSIEDSSTRLITNASCGYHVHVGTGFVPVDLTTAKNVFQLMTAYEKDLDMLHLPERFMVPKMPGSHLYLPLSFFHTAVCKGKEITYKHVPILKRFADIEKVQSYQQLKKMFVMDLPNPATQTVKSGLDSRTSGHQSSVNFDNLFSELPGFITGTIEFRQHAGTLDLRQIAAWIHVTCAIVRYARAAPPDRFLRLVLYRSIEHRFEINGLLQEIGCPDDVIKFYEPIRAGRPHVPDTKHSPDPAPALEALVAENRRCYNQDRQVNTQLAKQDMYGLPDRAPWDSPTLDPSLGSLEELQKRRRAFNPVGEEQESKYRALLFEFFLAALEGKHKTDGKEGDDEDEDVVMGDGA